MSYTGKKPIDVVDATTAQTLEVTTALEVDTIKDTGGTTAIEIDSNGTVTLPAVPAWRLELKGEAFTTAGSHDLEISTARDDAGTNHRRFIQGDATVKTDNHAVVIGTTGVYHISANLRVDGVGSGYTIMYIIINGSSDGDSYLIDGNTATNYEGYAMSHTMHLTSGDEVAIRFLSSADTSFSLVGSSSFFSGHLVG